MADWWKFAHSVTYLTWTFAISAFNEYSFICKHKHLSIHTHKWAGVSHFVLTKHNVIQWLCCSAQHFPLSVWTEKSTVSFCKKISTSLVTLLCAYTTDPRSFHVPPRRSIRNIRRIWRNLRLRMAEVAKTFPCEPAASTDTEAKRTMISAEQQCPLVIRWNPQDDCHPLRH